LAEGYSAVSVLDPSEKALETSKARLGPQSAAKVKWVAVDVTAREPRQAYDVWHDRATLTDPSERAAYVERVLRAVRSGGHVIIGTFALDGPERCSGLPVARYDAAEISKILGSSFDLSESRVHPHQTPTGAIQRFQFTRFRRLNSGERRHRSARLAGAGS
jgi:hypothetical protein